MEAKIYYTDGTTKDVQPKNGKDFKSDELHEIVEGYIEIVQVDNHKKFMVLNEEGKLNNLPINRNATILYQELHGPIDIIIGNVLVCDTNLIK